MANLKVDTVKMRECGKDITNLGKELNEALNQLYTRISNMPDTTGEWTGPSATEFVRKINIDSIQYRQFSNNIVEYGKFLLTEAEEIDNATNHLKL
ncbi:MAG: hypothetical protein RR047_03240 [Bacilli bacterium]